MKILYVLPGTIVAGGVLTVFEHANRLHRRGHEVYISSLQPEELPQQPTWYPLAIPVSPYKDIPKLAREVDLIIATLYTTAFYINDLDVTAQKAYFVQHRESLFAIPEAITIHHAEGHKTEEIERIKERMVKEYRKVIEKSYGFPFHYLCVSTWLQDFLKKEYNQDAVLIPNGINKEIFYPDSTYTRDSSKPVRVLVEASDMNIKWKGVNEALEATLGVEGIEIWTLGPNDADPNAPIHKHWKSPKQDEIRRIFSSCDILLKTSWYEGDGLPAKQAMTCGCAVITTDHFGSKDFLVDRENGLLAQPRNILDIKQKLVELVKNEELRKKLITNGFETAKKFDWESSVNKLEEAYAKWTKRTIDAGESPRPGGVLEDAGGRSVPEGVQREYRGAGEQTLVGKQPTITIGTEPVVSENEPIPF